MLFYRSYRAYSLGEEAVWAYAYTTDEDLQAFRTPYETVEAARLSYYQIWQPEASPSIAELTVDDGSTSEPSHLPVALEFI